MDCYEILIGGRSRVGERGDGEVLWTGYIFFDLNGTHNRIPASNLDGGAKLKR